ncbi:MAG: collagenase [Cellvibrionales bacterium]|nr:collagenase [Cellvibrionales bacterium]
MKKTNKAIDKSSASLPSIVLSALLLTGCFEIKLKNNDALNQSIESLSGQFEGRSSDRSHKIDEPTHHGTNKSKDISTHNSHSYSNKRSYLTDFSSNPSLINDMTYRLSTWVRDWQTQNGLDDAYSYESSNQDDVLEDDTANHEATDETDENAIEEQASSEEQDSEGFELPADPIDARFPDQYACNNTVILLAESMSTSLFETLCGSLDEKATHFHDAMQTHYQVVDDDYNDQLEIRIFNSYASYVEKIKDVSGLNYTTSGGFFYEGNPMLESNVAKIYVFEKSLSNGVWNLDHEFIHYLNGRYIKYGSVRTKAYYLFWEEGVAEYFANPEGDADARFALIDTFTIADILSVDSNDSQTKIYSWSYWLIRYLIEEQPNTMYTLSYHLKQGQFDEYEDLLDEISFDFEDDFQYWLNQH